MTTLVPSFLDGSSSLLQVTRPTINAWMSMNSIKIPLLTSEVVVTTLVPSFLIGSSSFLQATRKPITSWLGSKFGRVLPGTYELPALEHLEKSP